MTQFDLTGKVAIITGSSRGIGRAIAEAMADHGAKVVISSRKAEACAEAADAINAKHGGGTAIVVPANISSKEALQALADESRRQLGRIDILVCNAASNPYYGPMAGITTARPSPWRRLIPSATSWQAAALRELITTRAPCSASRSAMARPIPREEPVTTAARPLRSNRLATCAPRLSLG